MNIKPLIAVIGLSGCAVAQTSTYLGDLNNIDYSGLGPNGGIVTISYNLSGGPVVSSLGFSFDLDISFGAWDNTFTWGVDNAFSTLFTVNEPVTGFAQAVVTPTAGPSAAGWQLVDDDLDMIGLGAFGYDPVTGNFWDSTMSPSPNIATHSDVRVVSYSAAASGELSTPIDPVGFEIVTATLVYERVPEPSSVFLCSIGLLAALRRRR